MTPTLSESQKTALGNLKQSKTWATGPQLKTFLYTLDALFRKGFAEMKFHKYDVLWRYKKPQIEREFSG